MQQLMMVEGIRQYVTSRKALTTDLQYEPFRRMRKSLEQGPGHEVREVSALNFLSKTHTLAKVGVPVNGVELKGCTWLTVV